MRSLSRKFITLLLVLLMALSPLQSALAGDAFMRMAGCDMSEMHDVADMNQTMNMGAATMNCDHNNSDQGCDCSFGHCASVAAGLLSIFVYQAESTVAPVFSQANESFISQNTSSLFRPPRLSS